METTANDFWDVYNFDWRRDVPPNLKAPRHLRLSDVSLRRENRTQLFVIAAHMCDL